MCLTPLSSLDTSLLTSYPFLIWQVLYPSSVPYVYLNQSVQLLLVNPILLLLMATVTSPETVASGTATRSRAAASSASGSRGGVLLSALTSPLVVGTMLGLLAGQAMPHGLPPPLTALCKQVRERERDYTALMSPPDYSSPPYAPSL